MELTSANRVENPGSVAQSARQASASRPTTLERLSVNGRAEPDTSTAAGKAILDMRDVLAGFETMWRKERQCDWQGKRPEKLDRRRSIGAMMRGGQAGRRDGEAGSAWVLSCKIPVRMRRLDVARLPVFVYP